MPKRNQWGHMTLGLNCKLLRNKLPYLQSSGAEWLAERLGKANTRRREFLNYCQNHRKKLAYVAPDAPDIDDSSQSIFTVHTAPTSSTTASAFLERCGFQQPDLENVDFETQSFTSYSTSIANKTKDKLRIPPQPKESLDEKPFECPYCYTIQVVKGVRAWR